MDSHSNEKARDSAIESEHEEVLVEHCGYQEDQPHPHLLWDAKEVDWLNVDVPRKPLMNGLVPLPPKLCNIQWIPPVIVEILVSEIIEHSCQIQEAVEVSHKAAQKHSLSCKDHSYERAEISIPGQFGVLNNKGNLELREAEQKR